MLDETHCFWSLHLIVSVSRLQKIKQIKPVFAFWGYWFRQSSDTRPTASGWKKTEFLRRGSKKNQQQDPPLIRFHKKTGLTFQETFMPEQWKRLLEVLKEDFAPWNTFSVEVAFCHSSFHFKRDQYFLGPLPRKLLNGTAITTHGESAIRNNARVEEGCKSIISYRHANHLFCFRKKKNQKNTYWHSFIISSCVRTWTGANFSTFSS